MLWSSARMHEIIKHRGHSYAVVAMSFQNIYLPLIRLVFFFFFSNAKPSEEICQKTTEQKQEEAKHKTPTWAHIKHQQQDSHSSHSPMMSNRLTLTIHNATRPQMDDPRYVIIQLTPTLTHLRLFISLEWARGTEEKVGRTC